MRRIKIKLTAVIENIINALSSPGHAYSPSMHWIAGKRTIENIHKLSNGDLKKE
jgi:hypothetical protein